MTWISLFQTDFSLSDFISDLIVSIYKTVATASKLDNCLIDWCSFWKFLYILFLLGLLWGTHSKGLFALSLIRNVLKRQTIFETIQISTSIKKFLRSLCLFLDKNFWLLIVPYNDQRDWLKFIWLRKFILKLWSLQRLLIDQLIFRFHWLSGCLIAQWWSIFIIVNPNRWLLSDTLIIWISDLNQKYL